MRKGICVAVLLSCLLITACGESPTLTITNEASIPTIVRMESGDRLGSTSLISLSPGESRKWNTSGHLSFVAAPGNEWLKEAMIARDFLNEKLTKLHMSETLKPAEIADVMSRLRSIDDKIDALANKSARCSLEVIDPEGCRWSGEDRKPDLRNGDVTIFQQDDGSLSISCGTGP